MGFFKNKKKIGFIADIIRCDIPSYLIWKWHPDGTEPGEHKREYAIRNGSHLRVNVGEVAAFVYRQKNGELIDYIKGPFDQKLKTANFPILSGIIDSFWGGNTPFQAEIYFVNLAKVIQIRFAVPYFDVYDSKYTEFSVPVAVRGTITFSIDDYERFIELHRLVNFNIDDFEMQVKDAVINQIKGIVANAPIDYNFPVVQIERRIKEIKERSENKIETRLREDFGVKTTSVDISAIDIDKSSEEYAELMSITKDITVATVQVQAGANLEHYHETLRIQREEGQYAQHKQTQSENIGAYQIEKQAEVGIAGAEALGQMGANNAGGVDLGGGGIGFNPAAMMTSMAVGGVVGQNIASAMNGAISGGGVASTPPPIPHASYNVAKDGKPTGPFDIAKLSEMVASGELLPDSLVWKQGMATWEKAGAVEELKGLFPPPIV